jgi:hypothetical protein
MSEFSRLEGEFPRLGAEPESAPKNRGKVLRMALFHLFWAIILDAFIILALYFIVVRGDSGFIIMLSIGGFFGLLNTHQAIQFLRDLKAKPVSHEGDVLRKWHKGNMFLFFPSYYIMVESHVFTVKREEYAMLLEDDLVRVTCFPHSLTVELVERYDSTEQQFIPATSGASK